MASNRKRESQEEENKFRTVASLCGLIFRIRALKKKEVLGNE